MEPDDAALAALFACCRTIAVLGVKDGEADAAFRVPRYLQAHGYRIVPVSPKLGAVLGECCVPSLRELREPVDLVDVFRAPQHLPAHVDEILALQPRPRAVWFQQGIRDDASAERLRAAGIEVVQDRCLMLEHRRLCAGTPQGPASSSQAP